MCGYPKLEPMRFGGRKKMRYGATKNLKSEINNDTFVVPFD